MISICDGEECLNDIILIPPENLTEEACCLQVGTKFWEMICDEHGLAADGSWRGETSLQAERLKVYWNSKGNGERKHPADQGELFKVGGGGGGGGGDKSI